VLDSTDGLEQMCVPPLVCHVMIFGKSDKKYINHNNHIKKIMRRQCNHHIENKQHCRYKKRCKIEVLVPTHDD